MQFEYLREIDLFRNLELLHLGHLASLLRPLTLDREEVIFRPGDQPEYLYIIRSGRVRISSLIPGGGGEEALAILDAGSYFGEMKLLDDAQSYSVLATAHTDCHLDAFPLVDLRHLLSSDRDLAVSFLWNMVLTLSRRLEATNDKVAAMAKLSSPV